MDTKGQLTQGKLIAIVLGVFILVSAVLVIANPQWIDKIKSLPGFGTGNQNDTYISIAGDKELIRDIPSGFILDGSKYETSKVMKILKESDGSYIGFYLLNNLVYYEGMSESDLGLVINRQIRLVPSLRESLPEEDKSIFDLLQQAKIGPDSDDGKKIIIYLYPKQEETVLETSRFNLFVNLVDKNIASWCFMDRIGGDDAFSESLQAARLTEGGILTAAEAAELIKEAKSSAITVEQGSKVMVEYTLNTRTGKKIIKEAAGSIVNLEGRSWVLLKDGKQIYAEVGNGLSITKYNIPAKVKAALKSSGYEYVGNRIPFKPDAAGKSIILKVESLSLADGSKVVNSEGKLVGTITNGVFEGGVVVKYGNKLISVAKGTNLYKKFAPVVDNSLKFAKFLATNEVLVATRQGALSAYGLMCDAYTLSKVTYVATEVYAANVAAQGSASDSDHSHEKMLSKLRNKISNVASSLKSLESWETDDANVLSSIRDLRANLDIAAAEEKDLYKLYQDYLINGETDIQGSVTNKISPRESKLIYEVYKKINANLNEMGKISTSLFDYLLEPGEDLTYTPGVLSAEEFTNLIHPVFNLDKPLITGEVNELAGNDLGKRYILDNKVKTNLYFTPVYHYETRTASFATAPVRYPVIDSYNLMVSVPGWFSNDLAIGNIVVSEDHISINEFDDSKGRVVIDKYYTIKISNSDFNEIYKKISDNKVLNEIKNQVETLRTAEIRGTDIVKMEETNN